MKAKGWPTIKLRREVAVRLHVVLKVLLFHALIEPVLHKAAQREGGQRKVLAHGA